LGWATVVLISNLLALLVFKDGILAILGAKIAAVSIDGFFLPG
jgi:hypothetical protein